jgi:endonuclease/exonuclease/phosphatase family metal-dependent hydrolase
MTVSRILSLVFICSFLLSTESFSQKKQFKVVCVGFYNLENLFDTIDHENVNDVEFTPSGSKAWTYDKYSDKLSRLAEVISQIATDISPDGPAILGVSEIENRGVLEDLAKQPAIASRRYQIVHYDSPDYRGIDVAMLYNPKYYRLLESRSIPVNLPDIDGLPLITRDVLYTKGILDGDTVHIMVNHWPSRRGGEASTRALRSGCARLNREISDSLRTINPNAKIIVMGDLNDDPDNESVAVVLEGKAKADNVESHQFFNPFYTPFKKGMGSNAYQDAWSLFDQVLISHGFIGKDSSGYKYYKSATFNKPFMQTKSGRYKGYPFRTFDGDNYMSGYSDHFPSYVVLIKE